MNFPDNSRSPLVILTQKEKKVSSQLRKTETSGLQSRSKRNYLHFWDIGQIVPLLSFYKNGFGFTVACWHLTDLSIRDFLEQDAPE